MAKVVAFMDEGRSHGNDLTTALLPAAAPADVDQQPQQLPAQQPQVPRQALPSPQSSDSFPDWLPPPELPQENGPSAVVSPGPSPHMSSSFSNRSAR